MPIVTGLASSHNMSLLMTTENKPHKLTPSLWTNQLLVTQSWPRPPIITTKNTDGYTVLSDIDGLDSKMTDTEHLFVDW